MPEIPAQMNLYRLPFTDGTDVVEVDLPVHAIRLNLIVHDGDIHVCALSNMADAIRCERFRRYRNGEAIAGLNALNVVLRTTPSYVGTVVHNSEPWHVFYEPTPAMAGMEDLLRRYSTAPNVPPMSGETTSA